ncbi:DUF3324 domain-containing protein [Lactobacillus sp. ESL0785]|uniref:WxL protein host-binding domain-containing protein n=1 Tax=Lactobacillus sp. ESL0785 TaxID=2983232 RepID=UPI0023F9DFAE|nr:DUF3324 domain-containing protein [Lactobacillus sp. ESL0785]WEV71095.1 DUF3324 domain-containing protein [Lactobacillus sp. ESL0785]
MFGGKQSVKAAASFSVKVAGNDTTYIERKVKPREIIHVKLIFANNSSKMQRLKVAANPAFTGDNGLVQYNLTNPGQRYFGKNDFAKMTTGPKQIVLHPETSVIKTYTITIPKKKFVGVIAGGFYVLQVAMKRTDKNSAKENLAIDYQNVYAYAIPVVLRESNQIIHAKLTLEKATTEVKYANAFIVARIANVTPTMFGQLYFKVKLIDPLTQETVFEQNRRNMAMAPLSYFNQHILLDKNVPSGNYQLLVTVKSGKRHWKFKRHLRIDAKVAHATGEQVQPKSKFKNWLWLAVIGGISLLVILFSGMYYLSRYHSKK